MGETTHRYVYVHHLHHKWSKDVFVCIEGLKSSGTDSWHHRNGYEHAPKQSKDSYTARAWANKITHFFNIQETAHKNLKIT
jgi:hypothetical protein